MINSADVRADIEAVLEAAPEPESTPTPEPVEAPAEPVVETAAPEETEAQRKERVRDEKGRFARGEEAKPRAEEPTAEPKEPPPEAKAAPAEPAKVTTQTGPKAPQGWKPAAREEWAKVPESIRSEVLRREGEITQRLQETAESRKFHESFRAQVAPYEAMIRAEGGDPLSAVGSLLQSAAILRTAPMAVKAQWIAKTIQQYLPGREGVEAVDRALAGEAQATPQTPATYRDPRVDQIVQFFETAQQRQAQSLQARAESEVAKVQKEEFFEDVRHDMADIMEISAKRGLRLTPSEAYTRACQMNPEIAKVLASRSANAPVASTRRAQMAASSVRANPAPAVQGSKPSSLRDEIEAAMSAGR